MQNIKLIAVDLDGPMLVDTFSPVIHLTCEHVGVEYSAELERNCVSRNRNEVARYLSGKFAGYYEEHGISGTDEELVEDFFKVRNEYIANHETGMKKEVPDFLTMLKGLSCPLVSYGGLPEEYMKKELGEHAEAFERYICTNDFRPGVKEIVEDYGLEAAQVLFIDDVSFVAEHSKTQGTGFIGIPPTHSWSWQRQGMEELGVRHILTSVAEIDQALLERIDSELAAGSHWP